MTSSTYLVRTSAIPLLHEAGARLDTFDSTFCPSKLPVQGRQWKKPAFQRPPVCIPIATMAQSQVTQMPLETATPIRVPAQRSVQERGSKGSSMSTEQKTQKGVQLSRPGDEYFVTDKRPIVLFDGICNMCNGAVHFMLDNDPKGKLRYAALQSDAGKALLKRAGRSPDDHSSMVLIGPDRAYAHSDAILHIAQCLQSPVYKGLGSVGLLVPAFARDAIYDLIAKNRHRFLGTADSCRFLDESAEERFIS